MHPDQRLARDLHTLASADHDQAADDTHHLLRELETALRVDAPVIRRAANMARQCHTDTHGRDLDPDTVKRIRDHADHADALATAVEHVEHAVKTLRAAYHQHANDDAHRPEEPKTAPALTPDDQLRQRRNECLLCGFSEYDHPNVGAAHPFTPKD